MRALYAATDAPSIDAPRQSRYFGPSFFAREANTVIRMMAALFGALLCAGAAQAQVHKCVDASGKTVYSQAPCPKNARSTTIQATAPAQAPKPEPKSAAATDQDFKKRKLEQEQAAKKQEQQVAEAKLKEEHCRNARGNLAMLEQGGRQARINDKGERYFLEDAQIESEKDRARKAVQTSCG
jgi:hypothetical protein